jgi:ribokinase
MAGLVLVAGSTNTDLVIHCARLPRPGETAMGGALQTFAGGKGANQAVAAARAGARVRFLGAFGDDAFGRARRAELEREGVDCSGCVEKRNTPGGVALIALARRPKAENLILVAPGANACLSPEDIQRSAPELRPGDVLLCSLEVPLPAVLAALRRAAAAGAMAILNPAPFPRRGLPRRLSDLCDFLTPNETEFQALCGAPPGSRRAWRAISARRSRLKGRGPAILVTRGARGVDLWDPWAETAGGGHRAGYAVPPKVKAVDTVGAGDCFNGCLAAQLALGREVKEAVEFAVTAAALKVSRHGAQAGMPRREEVLEQLGTE